MKRLAVAAAVLLPLMIAACATGPEPVRWGSDMCDQCRMILVDKRFGAELVAKRVYKFDGLDELARFQAAHPEQRGTAYVTDGESGNLFAAGGAVFLASPDLKGPMGGSVMAFGQRQVAERFAAEHHLHGARYLAFAAALKESGGGTDAGR